MRRHFLLVPIVLLGALPCGRADESSICCKALPGAPAAALPPVYLFLRSSFDPVLAVPSLARPAAHQGTRLRGLLQAHRRGRETGLPAARRLLPGPRRARRPAARLAVRSVLGRAPPRRLEPDAAERPHGPLGAGAIHLGPTRSALHGPRPGRRSARHPHAGQRGMLHGTL